MIYFNVTVDIPSSSFINYQSGKAIASMTYFHITVNIPSSPVEFFETKLFVIEITSLLSVSNNIKLFLQVLFIVILLLVLGGKSLIAFCSKVTKIH